EVVGGWARLLRGLEHSAKSARHLRQAQIGFGRNIAVIRQNRRDHVDRAGALLQRPPRFAIGLHAGENIVGARGGGIIVELGGARGPSQHGPSQQDAAKPPGASYGYHRCRSLAVPNTRRTRGDLKIARTGSNYAPYPIPTRR